MFYDFVNELNEKTIKTDEYFSKIYKKYYFLQKYFEIYKNTKSVYYVCDTYDKLFNSVNLFKRLQIVKEIAESGEYHFSGSSKNKLLEPILNEDFTIKDGIILIEDRFLIKDLTKTFDNQEYLTLEELKKLVE